jgi:hypothetical protein
MLAYLLRGFKSRPWSWWSVGSLPPSIGLSLVQSLVRWLERAEAIRPEGEWQEIAANWQESKRDLVSGRMSFGKSLRIVCGSYCGSRRRRTRRRNPAVRPCVLAARSHACWEGAGSGRQTRMRIGPPRREAPARAGARALRRKRSCVWPGKGGDDRVDPFELGIHPGGQARLLRAIDLLQLIDGCPQRRQHSVLQLCNDDGVDFRTGTARASRVTEGEQMLEIRVHRRLRRAAISLCALSQSTASAKSMPLGLPAEKAKTAVGI